MDIREYRENDRESVISCFIRSVREIGGRYYGPEQVEAWLSDSPDRNSWAGRLKTGGVFVAEIDGTLAGFVRIEQDGFVDLLYVHPNYERRGVGMKLMQAAQAWAQERGAIRFESEVSIAALPLFEALGFIVEKEQTVERMGIQLKNFPMFRDTGPNNTP